MDFNYHVVPTAGLSAALGMRLTMQQMNFKSIFLDFIFGVGNHYISMINWCIDCLTPLPDGLSCPGRRCQDTGAELQSPVLCPMRWRRDSN